MTASPLPSPEDPSMNAVVNGVLGTQELSTGEVVPSKRPWAMAFPRNWNAIFAGIEPGTAGGKETD